MKKISFIIPCYRSEKSITSVVAEIHQAMDGLPQYDYELILVDDCSPDGTLDELSRLTAKDKRIITLSLAKNFGQHAALMAGFHRMSGDIAVCLDDDGQTPALEVGKLLEKLEEGYDVVYASYEHKEHSGFRNWGSRVNAKMTEIMLGKPKDLSVTSYFAARRFVVEQMIKYEYCYPYVIGLVLRTTKNICNVPVQHRAREVGESGYTLKKLLSLWMNGFTSFSIKPLRIATYFGLTSAVAGFVLILVIVVRYFTLRSAPLGWSSTTALLLLMGGIILSVLGLIGEYVGRIYMCTNASPQFVVRREISAESADNETKN